MKLLGLLATLSMSFAAQAASFDSDKASTFVEKEICTNSVLSRLDDALGENYKLMMASDIGADARTAQKAEQKAWLGRRNKCADYSCIEKLYRARIDEMCEIPVISGVHPPCTLAETIESW